MIWAIKGKETRKCPPEFQARLDRMFGRNIFGDPNFKFVWGATALHRMGMVWQDKDGNEHRGYREKYLCHGMPCWNLLRWKSAMQWGTPEQWYANTWDEATRLYILGEYPWRGRYDILQPFYSKEFINGKLVIEHLPLSHILIDKIIPLIERSRSMTAIERAAAMQVVREEQHRKDVAATEEIMMENLPAYYGAVSFSRQGIKTSLLARKEEQIRKQWDRLSARAGRRPSFGRSRGFFRGDAPSLN